MDEVIIEGDGFRQRRAFLTSAEFAREEMVIADEVRMRIGDPWQIVNGIVLTAVDIEAVNKLIWDCRNPTKARAR